MTAKKGTRQFTISAAIGLETSIQMSASSLEEAVQKSKDLTISDFIDILGEHNDSVLTVSGAYEYIPLR